ncbi:MAG: methyltransferase domain-containing protein [Verrucomicrobia bacterium]|nr:methyltransferase domain-containing protein [Verrucomicrobiota bacterium]
MSLYENYNQTAKNYDKTRLPIGLEIIRETFARSSMPILEQGILDAGCGTGNYARALLGDVRNIVALDGNEAMLREAKRKLEESPFDNYELKHGTLPKLPMEDESIDGIMVNQVIHHLDCGVEHAVFKKFCAAAWRVLKPGGHFVINTCGHRQLKEAYWYGEFIPLAVERALERYPSVDLIMSVLSEAGFRELRQTVPVEELFFGESYFDLDGPLKKEWRDGDSLWALLSNDELKGALGDYQRARENGELPALFERSEKCRKRVGQTVFVSARKP